MLFFSHLLLHTLFDLLHRGIQGLGYSSTGVKGPVCSTVSPVKSARKTLHACKYPRQTEGSFREVWAGK